jgi:hypothetical protein
MVQLDSATLPKLMGNTSGVWSAFSDPQLFGMASPNRPLSLKQCRQDLIGEQQQRDSRRTFQCHLCRQQQMCQLQQQWRRILLDSLWTWHG